MDKKYIWQRGSRSCFMWKISPNCSHRCPFCENRYEIYCSLSRPRTSFLFSFFFRLYVAYTYIIIDSALQLWRSFFYVVGFWCSRLNFDCLIIMLFFRYTIFSTSHSILNKIRFQSKIFSNQYTETYHAKQNASHVFYTQNTRPNTKNKSIITNKWFIEFF